MKILFKILRIVGYVVGVLIVLGVVLYFMALDAPDTPDSVASIGELEEFLDALVLSNKPPGVTISVIKDGAVVYEKAFGLADPLNGTPARADTVYAWWSMTKIPTALAVMQLHEQGLLDIDDPVADYLPFFDVVYPSPTSDIITIRHLLNHSSGIPNNVPAVLFWFHLDGEPELDQTKFIADNFAPFSTLDFEPGSTAVYTNLGYSLLGAVVEKASGESYSTYVRAHVLEPLAMASTDFALNDETRARMAVPTHPLIDLISPMVPFLVDDMIREVEDGLIYMHPVIADSLPPTGLIGPVSDVVRLVTAMLNGGVVDGQRILAPETGSMMLTESQLVGEGVDLRAPGIIQGLGWQLFHNFENSGRTFYEHSGGGPGFSALMRMYPEDGLGIVVMANGTHIDSEGIALLLASLNW